MDEVSLNSKPVGDDDANKFEIEVDYTMTELVGQTGMIQGENPLPPAVAMEFDSYKDVYYFYNCYAKEQGFGVRVSNTWYKKSKERYRGILSSSSAGFKKKSKANRPRPETRTGCPAMIKFRFMDSTRRRIIEVELKHNHLISPANRKFYKSHKHLGLGIKRTLQLDGTEDVQKIRLFRTVMVDVEANGNVEVDGGEVRNNVVCICGLFNFRGYLCRHALSVLNQNGIEEIPPQYILSRWRKDVKRTYVLNRSSNSIDIDNPVRRYNNLSKRIVQVVEEGRKSQDRYKIAAHSLDETLNKLNLVDDHQGSIKIDVCIIWALRDTIVIPRPSYYYISFRFMIRD
ncbi:protein FAR1-RELATED SEQUENCE 6-like [Quillaja saponaria]|uniref:Protein FAR1-RELATED SEQUENCE n=1 Tax=Quillaja saponaria TaxID=32244 RepID=A0AAD7L6S9_QUISA|nr:protein FAR1-RELATED SEQUENCE 6-like [Quillaja saponaria]